MAMMSTLTESKLALIDRWRSEGVADDILDAFEKVPREEFVPDDLKEQAYIDHPLHIGHEQTISQPTTVINMLSLLEVSAKMKVLEIGSGSGYVCALLAALGCEVIGIELIPELAIRAGQVIEKIGLSDRVAIHAADGSKGWEDSAPYDRILISAACPEVPRHLFFQLKDGGLMIAPVGHVEQRMIVCRKEGEDKVVEEDHGAYVFVPMRGRGIDIS